MQLDSMHRFTNSLSWLRPLNLYVVIVSTTIVTCVPLSTKHFSWVQCSLSSIFRQLSSSSSNGCWKCWSGTKRHIVDFEADIEGTLESAKDTVPFGKGLARTLMCTVLQACSIFVFLFLHCRFVCGVFRSSPCLRIMTKFISGASPDHRYVYQKYTLKEARVHKNERLE